MRALRIPLALGFVLASFACSKLTSPPAPEPIASESVTAASVAPQQQQREHERPPAPANASATPPAGDLKIDDVVVGKGAEVHKGDTVSVHYVGTLLDGTKFDASRDHPDHAPFTTMIPGNVIQGWNRGLLGMKVGGRRKLVVPPSLGYGPMPKGPIPANSTLLFDIELVDVKSGGGHVPPPPKGP